MYPFDLYIHPFTLFTKVNMGSADFCSSIGPPHSVPSPFKG